MQQILFIGGPANGKTIWAEFQSSFRWSEVNHQKNLVGPGSAGNTEEIVTYDYEINKFVFEGHVYAVGHFISEKADNYRVGNMILDSKLQPMSCVVYH
jgi:hypothetical protein